MRVGIDTTCWMNPRGYGRYTRNLVNALLDAPDGHVYVLFADAQTHSSGALDELRTRPNCEIVVGQTRQTFAASSDGQRAWGDMISMAQAVADTPLDVFFFPSLYTYYPLLPKMPIVIGIHDVTAEDYPRLMFPERRHRWLWMLKGWLARRQANWIVTVSDHAKRGIIRRFQWSDQRLWVVGEAPDPVFQRLADREPIKPVLARYGLREGEYFVCLGGLNPHKNLSMLLDVFARVRQDFPSIQLVLVGPAEDDLFTPGVHNLRQQIQTLGLESSVHVTGFLPDEEVVYLLNAARAFVMPSLNEGYGLGAVEAAACGTPVIATTSSPLPELLEGGGWFIDPSNPASLDSAMRDCLSDDARCAAYGQMAFERAQRLTWANAAEQFRALLHRLDIGLQTEASN